jgi:hypothetical protein
MARFRSHPARLAPWLAVVGNAAIEIGAGVGGVGKASG